MRPPAGRPSPRAVHDAPASRVSYTRTRPVRRHAVHVGDERDDVRVVRIVRVDDEREAEVGGKARVRPDVDPALARVVRAIDAAVELHEEPLGLRRLRGACCGRRGRSCPRAPPPACTAGRGPCCRAARSAPPSSESHTPTAEIAERDPRRVARPGRDRVHAHAAGAGAPVGPRRLLPERLVQLPRHRRRRGSRRGRRARRPRTGDRPPRRERPPTAARAASPDPRGARAPRPAPTRPRDRR